MEARENPFAPERLEQLAFRLPSGVSWESLLKRLGEQNHVGSIVGSHGTGKTSLLRDLAAPLREAGFEPVFFRLTNENSKREKESFGSELRKIVRPGLIMLDGAEQLSTRHWLSVRAAASQAAGFVITVYRVSRLPLLFECDPSPELLQDLVEELSGSRLYPAEAEDLIARHHGDLRSCFAELQELWEATPAAG